MTAEHPSEQHPILVTAILGVNVFEVTHPATGNSDLISVEPRHKVGDLAWRLATINEYVGQESMNVDYLRHRLWMQTELTPDTPVAFKHQGTGKAVALLGKYLPPEVISYEGTVDRPTSVTLGNIAVASRVPNEAELAHIEQYFLDKTRAKTEAAEGGKTDLTAYSHAIISVNEQRFLLELLSPMAILSARVIEQLQDCERGHTSSATDLARAAWLAMPLVERALFVDQESTKIYEPEFPPLLFKKVTEVIKLAGQLDITRRSYGPSKATIRASSCAIQYEEVPLGNPDPTLRPVYPPNTEHEYIANRLAGLLPEGAESQALTKEEMGYAIHVFDNFVNAPHLVHLNQQQAIELMDFIMTRRGKKALETLIDEDPDSRPLGRGLVRLHTIAKDALGYHGYQTAFRNRTIAGHHPTGTHSRFTFLAGGMPGLNTPANTTTRWYIGDSFAPPLPKEQS